MNKLLLVITAPFWIPPVILVSIAMGMILLVVLFLVGYFWASTFDFLLMHKHHEITVNYCHLVHAECKDIRDE